MDGLYLMDADGSGQHQLTGDGGQEPVFSPSGALIAYRLGGIAIANADGGGSHVVVGDQNNPTTNPPGSYFEVNNEPSGQAGPAERSDHGAAHPPGTEDGDRRGAIGSAHGVRTGTTNPRRPGTRRRRPRGSRA